MYTFLEFAEIADANRDKSIIIATCINYEKTKDASLINNKAAVKI